MNTDMVKVVENGGKLHDVTFVPLTTDPLNNSTFSLVKMGKIEDDTVILNLSHAVLVNSSDLNIEFVRASSRSKPFGASVTGS